MVHVIGFTQYTHAKQVVTITYAEPDTIAHISVISHVHYKGDTFYKNTLMNYKLYVT